MTAFPTDTIEEDRPGSRSSFQEASVQSRAQLDRVSTTTPSLHTITKSYPPISSIPQTSPERLAQAARPPQDGAAAADTVLYLAYGSNLCAETFLGVRGIRPVSQVNVSAPAFDLSFDLPGLPYREPCFANLEPRKLPKPPIDIPPIDIPPVGGRGGVQQQQQKWIKGLYGVVYEVTRKDYATIVRTEGGGASYHDVLTPCIMLPPSLHVPEKPPIPDLPKPFLAHTLYAPRLPDLPSPPPSHDGNSANNDDGGDDGDDDDDKPKPPPSWFRKLFLPVRRPSSDYAQPSPRYLKLIRDGAAEHALPDDYRAYLASLEPYTITSRRQAVGQFLMTMFMLPFFALVQLLNKGLIGNGGGDDGDDDGEGRYPSWAAALLMAGFNIMWMGYDCVFQPLFGDGERTQKKEEDGGHKNRRQWSAKRHVNTDIAQSSRWCGDEKNALLNDW